MLPLFQLPQGAAAVNGGSEGEPLDMVRQGRQIHLESGRSAGCSLREGHGPFRRAPLVIEKKIPLVGEAACAVQAKAGHVDRQGPLMPQLHLQGPGPADGLNGDLLSPAANPT